MAVLLEITGVVGVSREAVAVCSRATTVSAFALLGSTPVDMVIAHNPRGLPRPACPVKYFVDEQEALAWLARYCQQPRTGADGSCMDQPGQGTAGPS
ncbi:hypothetical protein AAHB33_08780 [Paenarthrobacter sp. S56]|uniref:DUF7793 family protein n=1 Tax=Paenarthrobacter sp. S56 TaxID=3138179 RepID=UPI00321A124C